MQRTGSIRGREERVPLDARVELRIEDGSEPRKADGLNVSIGGLALRAATMPPVGATVVCRFACPPSDEPITARGEVVWARLDGSASGRFGVRFLELDTKSATHLRRFVGPAGGLVEAQERLRSATIRIDGMGTSVEAELKLADDTRVVLEQELSFLQLGRAVEVSVEGRGPERGRIASVELRQSVLGGPTIVYGVLLDGGASTELRLPDPEPAAPASALFGTATLPMAGTRPPALTESVEQPITTRMSMPPSGMHPVTARVAAPPRGRRSSEPPSRMSEPPPEPRISEPSSMMMDAQPPRVALQPAAPRRGWGGGRARDTLLGAPVPPPPPLEQPDVALPAPVPPPADVDDDEPTRVHAGPPLDADGVPAGSDWRDVARRLESEQDGDVDDEQESRGGAVAALRGLPLRVGLMTRAVAARVRGFGQRAEGGTLEGEDAEAPDLRARVLLYVARARGLLLAAWAWLRGTVGLDGEASRPALRVQRTTLTGGSSTEPRFDAPRRVRVIAAVLTVLGIALGLYALTPVLADPEEGKPDDEAPVEAAATPPAPTPAPPSEPEVELDLQLDEPVRAPAPPPAAKRRGAKAAKSEPAAERTQIRASIGDPESTPVDEILEARAPGLVEGGASVFGDGEVPNGRTFTLRMNGPVKQVQGEARELGFTVRIPNRVAIDRASPIASAHNAVARAMILNRAGYAELTIEFRPGVVPRYQVRGKDNTLEVTLERL
ncbi:MAG: PilZ domain-containing protein [Polyangiales bacterium]